MKNSHIPRGLLLLILAALACNFEGLNKKPTATPTPTPLGGTPTPTLFVEGPGSNIPREILNVTSTAISQDIAATQAAQELLSPEARAATAAAFSPVLSQLPIYGLDPNAGSPGWMHQPITITVDGYQAMDYLSDFPDIVAEDFAVSADITWNTEYGNAGCGFVLRSDGNREAFNQYVVMITRAANGHAVMLTMAGGLIINIRSLFAFGTDPSFSWKNDVTNNLTVVARGQSFSIFSNGTLLGEINPSEPPAKPYIPPPPQPPTSNDPAAQQAYKKQKADYDRQVAKIWEEHYARLKLIKEYNSVFERGFVAMTALAESGYATCQFRNAWLWLIAK